MTTAKVVAAVLLISAVGVVVTVTGAAFSAATTNGGSSFATATSFCTDSTQTLTASADTYVDGAPLAQGSNFGTATRLDVRSDALGNRRTFVRFTLPSVPAYCSVTSATLRLDASSAAAGRTLQALRAAASWTESGLTWSNQPATVGTAVTTASGTGWQDWDATAHVLAMYAGANNGFVVRDAAEGAVLASTQAFSSREGASPAQLVLTFG